MIMDIMKDHSSGVQPAFGFGDGLDIPNVGFFVEPIVNVQPANSLNIPQFIVQNDQPALYLGPGLGAAFPGDPPQQQAATASVNTDEVYQITATSAGGQFEEVYPSPPLSIAQLIASHIANLPSLTSATGTAANNGSNNVQQPQLSVAQLVANAVQQHLANPPLNTNAAHQGSAHLTPSQAIHNAMHQVMSEGPSGTSSNQPAAAVTQSMHESGYFLYPPYDDETVSESYSDFDDGSLYSSIVYNVSSVPVDVDEESSNFSNPTVFHAPVSSPVHYPSDDGDYTPNYIPASPSYMIHIPLSDENSDNVNENSENVNKNQTNNADDVPNDSS